MYGGPRSHIGHPQPPGGQPPFHVGPPSSNALRGGPCGRRGRRPTIDRVVIGRDVHEATGFDMESLNRSMKITVPTMGTNTDFKYLEQKRIIPSLKTVKRSKVLLKYY
jgi:hypothetical protein